MSEPGGGGGGSGDDPRFPPGRARKTWPPPALGSEGGPPRRSPSTPGGTGGPPQPHGPHQPQPIFQPPPRHGSQSPPPQQPPQRHGSQAPYPPQPPQRHGSQAPYPLQPPAPQQPYPLQPPAPQQPYPPAQPAPSSAPQQPYPSAPQPYPPAQQPYPPAQQPYPPAQQQPYPPAPQPSPAAQQPPAQQQPYPQPAQQQPPHPFHRQPPPPYQPAGQPAPLGPAPHQQPFQPQPYQQAPQYQPPEPQAAATIQGWQPTQDPAWVGGNQPAQRHAPHSPAGESAPLQPPPTAAGTVALAVRRAFRLHIDPREVTDAERATLESSTPPITDPDVQGFLAWRRSVHMVVAIAILPLLVFQVVNVARSGGQAEALVWLFRLQLVIDIGFAVLLWTQLGRWNQWQKQRRLLAAGWLAYFLMPFVLYLYPLRRAMEAAMTQQAADPNVARVSAMLVGMVASLIAMIDLAPKAISLMPGLLRGALTSKLLFPGASGPGWLVLLLAPIYALLMYVVLIVPYQMTGNGLFVPAMIGLIGAQVWLGRAGYKLARPERLDEALVLVRKVRGTYVVLNLIGLVFVMIGLADMLEQFEIPLWRGLQIMLSLLVNVLLLTLIATDQIVANLVRGQRLLGMPGTGDAQADFARDIAHFDEQPRA